MPELSRRVGTFTDSVIRRMTRISNKYNAINLSQGFPDFDPPKEMLDALSKIAYNGPHQYAITFGAKNLREAICRKQSKAIKRDIDPETEIVITCGGTESMMCAMMTICNPGDKVLVFSPFYENYGADAILSGAEPIYVPLVPPEYNFDINIIENGFKAGAKAIIICNPSNPCGKVFTREELIAIGNLAVKYDAFVVTDEVYEHIVFKPHEHVYASSLPGMFEHTITCNSLSKTFSITGWRLGYVICDKNLVNTLCVVSVFHTYGVNTLTQKAAAYALNTQDEKVKQRSKIFADRMNKVAARLNSMKGVTCGEAEGAFYLFPSIKATGLTSELLSEAGVAVVPGSAFGESGEGYIRIACTQSLDILLNAMDRMQEFTNKLHYK